ncbi:hypothetical protein DC498_04375 [Terrimonas sp.]|uniref:DUF4349 domain-containing protein n=1 Tax=Terrimonas sp. TaxID=1914338 RepID=UPI000D51DB3C|nr:DUF4349 domain-containing protein [Terrimonas sp.]PVD53751.1 hypothetical protein DC498_04375 [Terrimonas sp.]
MKMHLTIAVIAATAILLSCHQKQNEKVAMKEIVLDELQSNASSGLVYKDEEVQQERAFKEPEQQKPTSPLQKTPPPVPADWDKRIIKNAELQIRVKALKPATDAIQEAVRSSGGYIASASEVQLSTQLKSEMLVRVPREKFEELLNRLSGYADSVIQKNITSEDVSDEYTDTKARILVKEKTRDQYFEFLKRTKNIEEVLKVQREITGLQEDIEAATGRINYIQHQSALSSIHLVFYQDIPVTTSPNTTPGFGLEILNSVKTGWTIIQSLIIMLVSIWPFWLIGIGVWFIFRRRKLKLIQTK